MPTIKNEKWKKRRRRRWCWWCAERKERKEITSQMTGCAEIQSAPYMYHKNRIVNYTWCHSVSSTAAHIPLCVCGYSCDDDGPEKNEPWTLSIRMNISESSLSPPFSFWYFQWLLLWFHQKGSSYHHHHRCRHRRRRFIIMQNDTFLFIFWPCFISSQKNKRLAVSNISRKKKINLLN